MAWWIMGTASLVIGLGLIIAGFFNILYQAEQVVDPVIYTIEVIIGIVLIVVGGLLLRKYDKDRKKEKKDQHKRY